MNKEYEELKTIVFKVNAIFEEDNKINILGWLVGKQGNNYSLSFFKEKKDKTRTQAFLNYEKTQVAKGDYLIVRVGGHFTSEKGKIYFNVKTIDNTLIDKLDGVSTPTTTTQVIEQDVPLDVPWELSL